MNKPSADDWPKAPLNGVLMIAVLFLSMLPALGWAWHRVLPEHIHVYIGYAHSDVDEIVPAAPASNDLDLCLNCKGAQITSGLAHFADPNGLQVLGVVGILGALFLGFVHRAFPETMTTPPYLYRSPILLLPDPPPDKSGFAV
jgi:hypothetical protein